MLGLQSAVRTGRLEEAKRLVESGANVNEKDEQNWTMLQYAVESGSQDVVKFLIENGANVNDRGIYGSTALFNAVKLGSLNLVMLLVVNGADINAKAENQATPLFLAVASGRRDLVEFLVKRRANVFHIQCSTYQESGIPDWLLFPNGDSVLHIAIRSGAHDIVKFLVENDANLDSKNLESGDTALQTAVAYRALDVVSFLTDRGANINCRNARNETALHVAVERGSLNVAKYLVEHGANVDCCNEWNETALHYAAKFGSIEIVKYLVEHGANVNFRNWFDGSALHLAAELGSREIVRYLVDHGAEINCKNLRDETALHFAIKNGSLEIVKYLQENAAEKTNKAIGCETVLHCACIKGNVLIADYLLLHGAVKYIDTSHDGSTPLGIACILGHTAIVQKLLEFNVDLRQEKKLICDNDEIINILMLELKKSVKHREKIHNLKTMDGEQLTKVVSPLKYFFSKKSLSIGKGSNGTSVYVGIMEDGSEVAVKRMLIHVCEVAAENEKKILSLIDTKKSPFIVSYRHFFKDNVFVYLVVDLCEETLKEQVHTQSVEHLRQHGPGMIKEIITGLNFLHDQGILHRDLKPQNVLVDNDGHMRLADFGISRVLVEDQTTIQTDAKGTQGWMPVEVIQTINQGGKCRFKKKSDVQVAGMISHFILTKGDHPFGTPLQRMENIVTGNPVNLNNLQDRDARHFVSWLISHSLDKRPYAHEALNNSYMSKIDDLRLTSPRLILRSHPT